MAVAFQAVQPIMQSTELHLDEIQLIELEESKNASMSKQSKTPIWIYSNKLAKSWKIVFTLTFLAQNKLYTINTQMQSLLMNIPWRDFE